MHVVTTHKGTDFDALASVVAVKILWPDVVAVLPSCLNPNVRAFLSLHKDLFGFCTPDEINLEHVNKLTVVDTNRWNRLDRLDSLKEIRPVEIAVFDHHSDMGDIEPTWRYQEEMGANITLMLRHLKRHRKSITPIQAGLFLAGIYEDTGNLTFLSTKAEDVHAAGYLMENGADLHIISTFLSPTYGRKQKDVLFQMLQNAVRISVDGYTVSINRLKINGYVSNLAVVLQMYRQILNVDAAFGIFVMNNDRCLVIGRSSSDGINVAGIMKNMGGGGHPGAGSALLKFVDPADVETWIRVMIGESSQTSAKISDHMSHPVMTLQPEFTMEQAGKMLRENGYKGAPVVDNGNLIGMLSRRDFQKTRGKSHLHKSVKAFMSINVVTISPGESPEHAARLMIKQNIGRLPVVDGGKIIGIFSRSDAVADFYGFCPLDSGFTADCKKRFSVNNF